MRWYSAYCFEVTVHQILVGITLFKDLSDLTVFLDNSSYSFHLIRLKHSGQLDYEVMQGIMFQGYNSPNFDRVIAL